MKPKKTWLTALGVAALAACIAMGCTGTIGSGIDDTFFETPVICGPPRAVTDAELESAILDSDKIVMLDFWSKGCGACVVMHKQKQFETAAENLSPENQGVAPEDCNTVILTVNIDEEKELHNKYVSGKPLPYFVFSYDGMSVHEDMGFQDANSIVGIIQSGLDAAKAAESKKDDSHE